MPDRRPRITKQLRDRMGRLLPMEYRPSELAEELGVHVDTIYRGWVPAGAPHRRDEADQLWIVGTELTAWLRQFIARISVRLGEGEGYCMRCNRAVRIAPPIEREVAIHAILVRGRCPQCGSGVARFVSAEEGDT